MHTKWSTNSRAKRRNRTAPPPVLRGCQLTQPCDNVICFLPPEIRRVLPDAASDRGHTAWPLMLGSWADAGFADPLFVMDMRYDINTFEIQK
jgi:hypothetical protein